MCVWFRPYCTKDHIVKHLSNERNELDLFKIVALARELYNFRDGPVNHVGGGGGSGRITSEQFFTPTWAMTSHASQE